MDPIETVLADRARRAIIAAGVDGFYTTDSEIDKPIKVAKGIGSDNSEQGNVGGIHSNITELSLLVAEVGTPDAGEVVTIGEDNWKVDGVLSNDGHTVTVVAILSN